LAGASISRKKKFKESSTKKGKRIKTWKLRQRLEDWPKKVGGLIFISLSRAMIRPHYRWKKILNETFRIQTRL
jgi:hypothetical protein